jgi:hypothetical protein
VRRGVAEGEGARGDCAGGRYDRLRMDQITHILGRRKVRQSGGLDQTGRYAAPEAIAKICEFVSIRDRGHTNWDGTYRSVVVGHSRQRTLASTLRRSPVSPRYRV